MAASQVSVLVVDDEPDLREALSEVLESAGYSVWSAGDGRAALRALRARERAADVIVLDLKMPIMDGEAFRWEQLADADLAHIPVIVLSALSECSRLARKLRTAGCIAKPFSPAELLEEVERACARPR